MEALRRLAAEKSLAHRANFLRRDLPVITLHTPAGLWAEHRSSALTDNFLPVEVEGHFPANQLMKVRVSGVHPGRRSARHRPLSCRFRSTGPMLYSGCVRSRGGLHWELPPGRDNPWRSTIALDKRSAKSFIRINDRIRAREIRVIDENGEQLGILPPFEALRIARERGLDLVEVSPNAVPPVCRIQDYGRYLYEKEKSERAARKKQKVIVVKEVKFSVTVDEHDYQTKKNQAVRFLTEGDKVKASLRFRGRQMAHRELGYNIINRLIQDIGDAGIVEFMPRMEGTILHAILAPSKRQEAPKPKPAPVPAAAQAQ